MQGVTPSVTRQVGIAVLLLAIVVAIAGAGSAVTISNVDGWYAGITKVPWNPPNEVFGPAWSVLYAMIALAGFALWRKGYAGKEQPNEARYELRLYAVQLVLNGLWTPIFFGGYPLVGAIAWWAALVVIVALVVTVVWLITVTMRRSKLAAWLLVPYGLWLLFATSLNVGIIALN